MAIRVLLDFDVLEEHITLLSLLMAPPGVNAVAYAFPKVSTSSNPHDNICLTQVRIVTTCVDPQVDERFWIIPGLGNFGDRLANAETVKYSSICRYYGTERSNSNNIATSRTDEQDDDDEKQTTV